MRRRLQPQSIFAWGSDQSTCTFSVSIFVWDNAWILLNCLNSGLWPPILDCGGGQRSRLISRFSLTKKRLDLSPIPLSHGIVRYTLRIQVCVGMHRALQPTKLSTVSEAMHGAALPDHIYMDAMGFGMGCCCLQLTFQACNVGDARRLYDRLIPIGPILVWSSTST
jgi:hypothetical protein